MLTEKRFSTVSKILILQILVITTGILTYYILGDVSDVLSAFCGGIAAFLPNLYMTLRMIRTQKADAQKIVRSFYAGESGKLILTGILFFIIFQIPTINLLPLLAVYVAALSVFWFALVLRD